MPDGVATAATAPIVLDAIGKRFDTSTTELVPVKILIRPGA